jgi:uncharacterized protein YPO0396
LDDLRQKLGSAKLREKEAVDRRGQLEGVLRRLKVDLPEQWTSDAFDSIKEKIRATERNTEDERKRLAHLHGEKIIERNDLDRRIQELKADLRQLESRPGSAIDGRYQSMRERISAETGVLLEAMPFVGELIDIKPDQTHWQGAIERALGFVRLRFLTEEKHKQAITSYINRENQGLRIGFEVVKLSMPETEFRDRSFLRKLQWSSRHPFIPWLKRYLSEHTLDCYDTREEMLEHPFSMTVTGLIQRKLGSFDKDDNTRIEDRSKWYIGFSSEPRKVVLRKQLDELTPLRDQCAKEAQEALDQVQYISGFAVQAKLALDLEWTEIDVEGHHANVTKYAAAIAQIEERGLDLKKAEDDMHACEKRHQDLQSAVVNIGRQIGGLERDIQDLTGRRERAAIKAAHGVNPVLTLALEETLEVLTGATLDCADEIEQRMIDKLQGAIKDIGRAINGLDRQASTAMTRYRTEFKVIGDDLPERAKGAHVDDAEALQRMLAEWVAHYRALVDSQIGRASCRERVS